MKAAAYCGTRNLYTAMIPAVRSLIQNSDVDKVYVLIEDDVFPYDLPVEAINVSGMHIFRDDGPNYNCIWSYMALMRAALHRVFPQYDRILSLDVDTIVDRDISNLWDTPLDDFYLAGVREPLKSNENLYVNAGVMLLNLKKLRDGRGDWIVEALNTRKYTWPEQDCINSLCAGQIYELPPEYNMNDWTARSDAPKIIHYAGKKDYLNLPAVLKYTPYAVTDSRLFAGKEHYKNQSEVSISVIMTVFNTEEYLRETIESVIRQSFSRWELVIIDDGSTDKSGQICDEYARSDSRIVVRHTENRGVDPARNLGLDVARGKWITFLDSDDLLTENALEVLYSHAAGSDAVIAGYRETPGTKRYQPSPKPKRISSLAESAEEFIRIDRSFALSCQHAKLFRKSAIKVKFREDQPFADDTYFNIDNLFDVNGICFLPDYLYIYRRRSDPGALHNTRIGRLETSHALMRLQLEAFPGSDIVRNYLTGKMIIRVYNHLLRLVSRSTDEGERIRLIEELLKKTLFDDPLLRKASTPLPELCDFRTAVTAGDTRMISQLIAHDKRPIRSDSPGLISVIMPVCNMINTLKRAVDSILSQTYAHWELVIVDDGSTDGSGALADSFMERDARILTIHQQNSGVGAARNAAFPYVHGEWLAFLDADDEYLPDAFEHMIRASKGADLVNCAIYAVNERVFCKPYDEIHSFDGLPEGRDLDVLWANYILPIVWGKIYRRHAVKELFDTSVTYGEDTLFNFKVFPTLGKIVLIPEPGYKYHKQRDRIDRGMLEGARRQVEYAAAWFPDNDVLLRRTYMAFIRSARFFALSILDSDTLSSEDKAKELEFCGQMVQLPPELDREEFLFPENLEWWRLLKAGDYRRSSDGLRVIRTGKMKKRDHMKPDEWIYPMRG